MIMLKYSCHYSLDGAWSPLDADYCDTITGYTRQGHMQWEGGEYDEDARLGRTPLS